MDGVIGLVQVIMKKLILLNYARNLINKEELNIYGSLGLLHLVNINYNIQMISKIGKLVFNGEIL